MSASLDKDKPNFWYPHENLLQWLTLAVVVVGGVLHYFLIDLPAVRAQEEARRLTEQLTQESAKNQKLIDQKFKEADANTEALKASMDQILAQTELSKATIDQIRDPAKKESERLAIDRQRAENIKFIDELINSFQPNLQVKLMPKVIWATNSIYFEFSINNLGIHPFVVASPPMTINMHPKQAQNQQDASLPATTETSTEMCTVGFISPGETLQCGVYFRVTPTTAIDHIDFSTKFIARIAIPKDSRTWKLARSAYTDSYIESKLEKTVNFSGDISR